MLLASSRVDVGSKEEEDEDEHHNNAIALDLIAEIESNYRM